MTNNTNKKPSLILNSMSNSVTLGLNIVIGLFLTPFIIKSLGKGGYGIWTLVWSIVGYYGFLNFGITTAVERFIARNIGKNDKKTLIATVNSALLIFGITGILSIVISFAFAHTFASFLNIETILLAEFTFVIKVLGIVTGFTFVGAVATSFIRAHEKFVTLNMANVSTEIVRVVLTLVALNYDYGLKGLALATFVSTGIRVVLHFGICFYSFTDFRIKLNQISFTIIKQLGVFGIFLWITFMSNILRNQVDSVVIAKFLNVESVGVYAVAALMIRYLNLFSKSIASVFMPRLSRLAGEDDYGEFTSSVFAFSNSIGVATFGVGILLFILGPDFISFWVGEGFEDAKIVLLILLIGQLIDSSTSVSFGAMVAVNKHKFYAYSAIAEGFANLFLSIFLVKKIGIYGVALGTIIPLVITKLIVQAFYCSKTIKISALKFLYVSIFKPLSISTLIACSFHFFFNFEHKVLLDFIISAILIIVLYTGLSAVYGLTLDNKKHFAEKLTILFKRTNLKQLFN